jgi:hypothetical protein
MRSMPVGVIWYRGEQDYARLKAMAKDGGRLHDTYDEWLKSARNVAGTLTLEGLTVVKTYLDPKTFPAWCEANGYEMDAVARTRYSQECAARKFEPKP